MFCDDKIDIEVRQLCNRELVHQIGIRGEYS